MTDKTRKSIMKKANIEYHNLALGLYSGYIKSSGTNVDNEILEYFRFRAKEDRQISNIMKTKEQKDFAVGVMIDNVIREFGTDTAAFM